MDYIIIEVPDMNDSVVRVTLLGKQYKLRFTWSDSGGYWMLGVLDSLGEPLIIGTKIIPQFPLNLFWGTESTPQGVFAALTEKGSIGREDFVTGAAQFVFIPA